MPAHRFHILTLVSAQSKKKCKHNKRFTRTLIFLGASISKSSYRLPLSTCFRSIRTCTHTHSGKDGRKIREQRVRAEPCVSRCDLQTAARLFLHHSQCAHCHIDYDALSRPKGSAALPLATVRDASCYD